MAIGRSAPPPVSNGLSSTRMMNNVVVITTATAPIWSAWTYHRSAGSAKNTMKAEHHAGHQEQPHPDRQRDDALRTVDAVLAALLAIGALVDPF